MKKVTYILITIIILILTVTVFTACNSSSHTHKWGSWYDNGDGTHMRMCSTDSEHTEYAPHVFGDYEITEEPTDILPGTKERKCTLCGYKETEVIPYTGDHVFDKEIDDDCCLYKKINDYSAVYYKSCECGAYGNPDYLFEASLLPEGYSDLEYVRTDINCLINTDIDYDSTVKINYSLSGNINIPEEYTRVEYLETDGTAYIDTGYNETDETTIDCDLYIDEAKNHYVFGGTQKAGFVYNGFYSNYIFEYNFHDIEIIPSERLYMTQVLNGDTMTYNINGTVGQVKKGTSLKTRMFLFACNGGQRLYEAHIKCYMFRIYDNGRLMRDFVPCVRKSDKEAGMYDMANDKFYENAGDGNFIAKYFPIENTDIWEVPSLDDEFYDSYEVLEYIEGNGSQQINTGISMNPETDAFEIIFKSNEIKQNGMILASKEDDNYLWLYHY